MKKLLIAISAGLALFMLLPLAAFANEGGGDLPFSDVGTEQWYYKNVKRIYDANLMKGISDTEFDPEGTLTRGMCVTILYRVANEPAVKDKASFADVADGEYYADAVAWAENAGVVNGRTATAFDPDGEITREEFAAMLYRFLGTEEAELEETREGEPADAAEISDYAAEAVGAMYRSEVVNGRENGEFDPSSDITRAETSAMLDRFLDVAHADIRVVEEYGQICVRITFRNKDEHGEPKTTADVVFGYVPEGMVLEELEEDERFPDYRHVFMNEEDEEFDGYNRLVVVSVLPAGIDPGFSGPTWERVYLTEINGMDAFAVEVESEDGILSARGIVFGDGDVTITLCAINVDIEEALTIAENITW